MTKRYLVIILIATLAAFFGSLTILHPAMADAEKHTDQIIQTPLDQEIVTEEEKLDPEQITTYAQEVWIYALEWCESRGKPSAINEVDLDGTSSYYSFQFKPGTFRYLGESYNVIPKGHSEAELMELLKDTELQRAIVRHMIKDTTTVWERQFPGCVRQLGRPPIY